LGCFVKIGMIGLGKLGFTSLLAMEHYGNHEVRGYDVSDGPKKILETKLPTFEEEGFDSLLQATKVIIVDSISDLVDWADIVFVAVQTPHSEKYEGITPTPDLKIDFNYSYLKQAINEISNSLAINQDVDPLIVVISTVLPGTMRREVIPMLSSVRKSPRFCYNPYFIAMGTTINDFMNPEFMLIGSLQPKDSEILETFYKGINGSTAERMEIESAELTKVAYNTFIGFKIVFANTIAEIVEKIGRGNSDEVTGALSKASHRLMSGKYMRSGMGDGGGCHPRDQIAMSYLAQELKLSADPFEWLAKARDSQTQSQAELIREISKSTKMKVVLLGWAYKPDTSLTIGSPAKLLGYFLDDFGVSYEVFDPFVYPEKKLPSEPAVFFISSNHKVFESIKLPANSVVIDPWGISNEFGSNVKMIRPGRTT
jgi:UDPglucose 6-dehydrogenase